MRLTEVTKQHLQELIDDAASGPGQTGMVGLVYGLASIAGVHLENGYNNYCNGGWKQGVSIIRFELLGVHKIIAIVCQRGKLDDPEGLNQVKAYLRQKGFSQCALMTPQVMKFYSLDIEDENADLMEKVTLNIKADWKEIVHLLTEMRLREHEELFDENVPILEFDFV